LPPVCPQPDGAAAVRALFIVESFGNTGWSQAVSQGMVSCKQDKSPWMFRR